MACYTKIYFLSNEPLHKQYPNIQIEKPDTWQALMRRIHNVYDFNSQSDIEKCNSDTPTGNPLFKPLPQICEQAGMRILSDDEVKNMPF